LGAPPHVLRKLKLTDDQRKQMRLKYVDFKNKTREARIALMGLHDEKRTMLISGTIDQAKLAKCDEEITKLTAEVMTERLKMDREQLAGLTQEQIDRLADFPCKMEKPRRPKKESK
jgi:Spy/CpxP family protein refolding chaperone